MGKNKIINDPVHGFIEVPQGILLDLIDTDVFQRLRRIRQLALSSLVYPGAVHTRFNHALGAMHLTGEAMDVLKSKGIEISANEFESTLIAILLHDVGHGPFSHALESVIITGLNHENMSRAIMLHLNKQFKGKLDLAISIFEGKYHRRFFHELVSSQLDMDRMDYLVRDSYFTGVVEGLVAGDRIIKTLNVVNDRLVVEEKGIYSVEKFIVARRLMYWQVYLHKAVVAAEYTMVHILQRARELMYDQKNIWKNPLFEFFFRQNTLLKVEISAEVIERYVQLDDEDIMYAIKQWAKSGDPVLEFLCNSIMKRSMLKAIFLHEPMSESELQIQRDFYMKNLGLDAEQIKYICFTGQVTNLAYLSTQDSPILILKKDGTLLDISQASDLSNVMALSTPVTKSFLCRPA